MRRPYVRRTRVGALLDCALRQHFLPEPCQEIRPVGLIMKDRLLVVAASGEGLEGARIFHTKLRAMNAEPRGREVQGQAMPPSPLRQSQRNLLAGFA